MSPLRLLGTGFNRDFAVSVDCSSKRVDRGPRVTAVYRSDSLGQVLTGRSPNSSVLAIDQGARTAARRHWDSMGCVTGAFLTPVDARDGLSAGLSADAT